MARAVLPRLFVWVDDDRQVTAAFVPLPLLPSFASGELRRLLPSRTSPPTLASDHRAGEHSNSLWTRTIPFRLGR